MNAAWNVRRMNGVRSGPRRVKDFLALLCGGRCSGGAAAKIGGAIEDGVLNGSGPDHTSQLAASPAPRYDAGHGRTLSISS